MVAPCRREIYAYGETGLSGNQAVDECTIYAVGLKRALLDWPIVSIQGVKHVLPTFVFHFDLHFSNSSDWLYAASIGHFDWVTNGNPNASY
jgi:hypothetical protein